MATKIRTPETIEEKVARMTTAPVEKLILKLAVPTIISMLVTAFYNLADTFFVRQLQSDSMVAAVGIVLPLMAIIQAFGFFFGHGSGNYISRALGRGDRNKAETMASAGFYYAIGVGVIIGVFGLLFQKPFATLLGAKTAATSEATISYMRYILIAAPVMMGAIVLNNQLRMQGNAFFAMIGLTTGAVLNIILDPLFIYQKGDALFGGAIVAPFGAGMGIGGAALATAISQGVSFLLLLIGLYKSDNAKVKLKNFTFSPVFLAGIIQGGLPSLARQGLNSIATTCLNHAVGIYITGDALIDATQAALTATSKLMMFLASALIGFGQGFQPVCGFNYGAERYDRVRKAYYFCMKVAVVALVIISTFGIIFAKPVSAAVAGSSKQAAEIAARAFRAQLIVFPVMSWVFLCNMMLQTIGMTFRATIVAMARQGLAFIPCVLLLPLVIRALGGNALNGLIWAQSVADLFAFVIAIPIGIIVLRELKTKWEEKQKTLAETPLTLIATEKRN